MQHEATVQNLTRLELARLNGLPMRNNVGVAQGENGRPIRFGLMNDSAQLNAQFKSSDLICPIPVFITPEHVGKTLAIFGAFECKKPGWHLTPGDQRGQAQLRFIELIHSVGGFGGFVTDPSDVHRIIARG